MKDHGKGLLVLPFDYEVWLSRDCDYSLSLTGRSVFSDQEGWGVRTIGSKPAARSRATALADARLRAASAPMKSGLSKGLTGRGWVDEERYSTGSSMSFSGKRLAPESSRSGGFSEAS